ncbi:MAG TPA: hypothetical protein VFR37_08780 [Longimicrobium sp.]|nr:hypothetical protein [Longimicrobium sp.]
MERWKRFPPEHGGLLLPLDAGPAAAVAALGAYAGCRPGAGLARAAAAGWARLLGPGRLPGHPEAWDPPLAHEQWEALLETLRRRTVRFDALAVLERRQPHRAGLALLLLQGGSAAAFVKLRPAPSAGLAREAEALDRLEHAAPRAFHAPVLLDRGTAGEWEWLALSALPGPHHVPRSPRLDRVCASVWGALADLPRDLSVPSRWTPMHGDLTPWNLRESPGHGLLLYDWERAGWGPPGADAVLYQVTEAALRGSHCVDHARWRCARWPEAAAFWAARLRRRHPADEGERRLLQAQLDILDPGGRAEADETGLLARGSCPAVVADEEAEKTGIPASAGGAG